MPLVTRGGEEEVGFYIKSIDNDDDYVYDSNDNDSDNVIMMINNGNYNDYYDGDYKDYEPMMIIMVMIMLMVVAMIILM